MSIQAVREIRAVEESAESIIEFARKEAQEQTKTGEAKAAAVKLEAKREALAQAKALLNEAIARAESEAKMLLEKAASESEQVRLQATRLKDEAVRFITEKVVG
jgi:vacuolar-type H+-ATPase subunit H